MKKQIKPGLPLGSILGILILIDINEPLIAVKDCKNVLHARSNIWTKDWISEITLLEKNYLKNCLSSVRWSTESGNFDQKEKLFILYNAYANLVIWLSMLVYGFRYTCHLFKFITCDGFKETSRKLEVFFLKCFKELKNNLPDELNGYVDK